MYCTYYSCSKKIFLGGAIISMGLLTNMWLLGFLICPFAFFVSYPPDITLIHFRLRFLFTGPRPHRPPKVTANLKSFVKLFSLKQKANQILPVTAEKIKVCLFKKSASCFFLFFLVLCKFWSKWPRVLVDKGLKWGNVKQKPFRRFRYIHVYSSIFRHIQAESGILRNDSSIFRQI